MVPVTGMRTRPLVTIVLVFATVAGAAVLLIGVPELRAAAFWQKQASPGALSAGHAFLASDCAQCHTPVAGPEPVKCIACHANDRALLGRQPTSFHANIGACADCHREHRGPVTIRTAMNHEALVAIGERRAHRPSVTDEPETLRERFLAWRHRLGVPALPAAGNPHLTRAEAALDCRTCHATRDVHVGLFGRDCAQCHATGQWTLPEFRHPSPRSLECAQCHQAPPSHYMEHFRMISMRIAGEESARVDQCYLCHQTTAWNDIRSVGYYKHH